jgi:hypothetical protein
MSAAIYDISKMSMCAYDPEKDCVFIHNCWRNFFKETVIPKIKKKITLVIGAMGRKEDKFLLFRLFRIWKNSLF